MTFLKSKRLKIERDNHKYLKNTISPTELILICVPFTISMATTKDISQSTFGFVITTIFFMISLIIMYLAGIRRRFLYFLIILCFGVFLILFLGKPWEYWLYSDRDSKIRAGTQAILKGENPYKAITQIGHKANPLPFTCLFYLPIYLIICGYTFYMNLMSLYTV